MFSRRFFALFFWKPAPGYPLFLFLQLQNAPQATHPCHAQGGGGDGLPDEERSSQQGQSDELVCSGRWKMEGDDLHLELSGRDMTVSGSFPVEISPSGEQLRIHSAKEGEQLPFLQDQEDEAELTLYFR